MKFTGHERDLNSPAGAGDDLDYMHARHCSPVTGRFLSVDPAGESINPQTPQSWNRYNYVQSNPLKYSDPSGAILVLSGTAEQYRKIEEIANQGLNGMKLVIDDSGRARLESTEEEGEVTPQQEAFVNILGSLIDDKRTVSVDLVSGSFDVLVGSYSLGAIDVVDLNSFGSGPVASSFSILGHELVEQAARQWVTASSPWVAHQAGIVAQNIISGFTRDPGTERSRDWPDYLMNTPRRLTTNGYGKNGWWTEHSKGKGMRKWIM